ncbi:MAG: radical SAM/SPASM domain-containing protein [Vicinamibacterales bacterium]
MHRIERLHASLEDVPAASSFDRIVRRACDDTLGLSSDDGRCRFVLREHVIEELRRLPDHLLPRYLFYRYRYEVFPQTHEVDGFPPCLQIEPTSICNYRCVFCYQTDRQLTSPGNGHMGLMSLDLFKRVIDEAEGRCEAVTLASRGEPLMARQITEMLGYLRGKFVAAKVNTNAWFLDEAKAHALLEADLNTLVFSADAAEPELYGRLRVNGRLDRVLANVEMFARIRERDYPTSRTITRVSGVRVGGQQDIASMQAVWGGLVDQVAFVDYQPWENTYERPLSAVDAPCSDLWRRMFVWWDGRINPCDVDYRSTLSGGRLGDTTLADAWRGEAYDRLRAAHVNGGRSQQHPCNRCTLV